MLSLKTIDENDDTDFFTDVKVIFKSGFMTLNWMLFYLSMLLHGDIANDRANHQLVYLIMISKDNIFQIRIRCKSRLIPVNLWDKSLIQSHSC